MHVFSKTLAVGALYFGAVGHSLLIPENLWGTHKQWEKAVAQLAELSKPEMFMDTKQRVVKSDCFGCLADGGDGALVYSIVASDLGRPRVLINGAEFTPYDVNTDSLSRFSKQAPPFIRVPLIKAGQDTLSAFEVDDLAVDVGYDLRFQEQYPTSGAMVSKMLFIPKFVNSKPVKPGMTKGIEVFVVKDLKKGTFEIVDARDIGAEGGLEVEGYVPEGMDEVDENVIEIEEADLKALGLEWLEDLAEVEVDYEEVRCEGYLCELIAWGKKAEEKVTGWGKGLAQKLGCHGGEVVDEEDDGVEQEIEIQVEVDDSTAEADDSIHGNTFTDFPFTWEAEEEGEAGEVHAWTDAPPARWSHPHHHHHHHHEFDNMVANGGDGNVDEGLTLSKIFIQVLWPITVGVAAGIVFSILGMVLGHFVVVMWHFVRGTTPVSCKKRQPEEGGEVAKGLLEEQDEEEYLDAPPEYQGGAEVVQEKQ